MREPSDADRARAAELYETACRLHQEKRYSAARPYYERSLDLCEDDEVREAYRRLLATIGPA